MQKNHIGKILAIGIIVLFIGAGIHPAFAVDTHTSIESIATDNDLIEMPVQIHTSTGIQRHTLELTNQQVDELGNIFDKLKVDLWDSDSYDEVTEVYKEAIVLLDENGLLPDALTIEKAQKLVIPNNIFTRFGNLLNYLYKKSSDNEINNTFCYITGKTSNTYTWFGYSLNGVLRFLNWLLLGPIRINHKLVFGDSFYFEDTPAVGWVYTKGLFGVQQINNSFYGRLEKRNVGMRGEEHFVFFGAVGFTGLMFESFSGYKDRPSYYNGYASKVHLR